MTMIHQVKMSTGFDAHSTSHVVATCLEVEEAEAIAEELGILAHVNSFEFQYDTFESWYERTSGHKPGKHAARS